MQLRHVRQHEVLFVGDAHFAEPELLAPSRYRVHLLVGDVAGRHAGGLGRERDDGIARLPVGGDVVVQPHVEGGVRQALAGEERPLVDEVLVGGALEAGLDAADLLFRQGAGAVAQMLPLGVRLLAELLRGHGANQNLDARLVLVVAPPVAVVDAQNRFQVGEQMPLRQAFANQAADHRRTAKAAADVEVEERRIVLAGAHGDADVVNAGGGAVGAGAVHGDLELARQPVELSGGRWTTGA